MIGRRQVLRTTLIMVAHADLRNGFCILGTAILTAHLLSPLAFYNLKVKGGNRYDVSQVRPRKSLRNNL